MAKENIENTTFLYYILKVYTRFVLRFYYKKIEIVGLENVPLDKPVILALNHQNALMDALVVLTVIKQQPVFLARADIFKKPLVKKLLTAIKILPVYRIRDGFNTLGKNEETFDETTRILLNNKVVAIMPEGNHGDKHTLRPLVKGLFRIAFKAQEVSTGSDSIQIIPVGLEFEDYIKVRKNCLIRFGEPIVVKDFYSEYQDDAPSAYNSLRDHLALKMSAEMTNIRSVKYYHTFDRVRKLCINYIASVAKMKSKSLNDKFNVGKIIYEALDKAEIQFPEKVERLEQLVKDYDHYLDKNNIKHWIVEKQNISIWAIILQLLGHILILPLFVYGAIFNIIPFIIPVRLTKKIKDLQFHSSFKYGISFFLFPIYYIILAVVFLLITANIWYSVLFLVTLPIAGLFSITYYLQSKKLLGKFNFLKMKKTDKEKGRGLLHAIQDLTGEFVNINNSSFEKL